MSNKQNGSSAHIVIIIILVVAVLGLLGFVFWQNFGSKLFEQKNADSNQTTDSKLANAALSQTYSSSVGRFSISYPEDWTLSEKVDTTDSNFPSDDSTLTSPTGTILNITAFYDARGGVCPVQEGDVAFQAGNSCVSKEYLSKEKLDIDNLYHRTNIPNNFDVEKIHASLVTTKFGTPDGEVTYGIGAATENPLYPIEVNKPAMGLISPEDHISHVDANGQSYPEIYVYITGQTESFLTSADADTIKSIIRSLRINNN